MKIKRFHARTMRDALKQVRDEQGPDAVILSKERLGDGIEVIAAVDYDEALLHQSKQVLGMRQPASRIRAASPVEQPPEPTSPEVAPAQPAQQPSIGSFFARVYSEAGAARSTDDELADESLTLNEVAADYASADDASVDIAAAEPDFRSIFETTSTIATLPEPGFGAESPLLAEIATELRALRQTVSSQYSELRWDARQRHQPHLADVIERLDSLGLSPALVRSILAELDPQGSDPGAAKKVWRHAIGLLAKRIPVAAQDVCAEGGTFALVGPTGAGKTTSIAKLATRFALEHDPQELGLVTTDSFRIGAQEHLLRFGRILGVPVQVAGTAEALRATLDQLADRKLILIDTAGFSLNDTAMLENLEGLTRQSPTIQTLLALPANLQSAALRQAIGTFDRLGLDGAIATKLDEATSLGGLLSAAIEANLAFCYVADGQRVPEDLKPAGRFRAGFVSQAVSLARAFNEPGASEGSTDNDRTGPRSELHAITTDQRVASYG